MKVEPVSFYDPEMPLISSFQFSTDAASDIVEAYRNRKLAEELDVITEYGGVIGVVEKLKSNRQSGLITSTEDYTDRVAVFGKNKPPKDEKLTYFQLCWNALKDNTLRILIVSGTVSLIIGAVLDEHPEIGWIEGFAIILAVFIVVNVSAINDFQKQKKFYELKKQNQGTKSINVLRDSTWKVMHPKHLLAGDIVKLENGIIIPADGILIEASSIEIVESAMTGENENIKKLSYKEAMIFRDEYFKNNQDVDIKEDKHHEIPSPIILSGTNLAEGVGVMVVVAVGKNSAEGRIKELAGQEEEETPLMKKLNKLTESIAKAGVICSAITMLALFIRFGAKFKDQSWNEKEDPNLIVKYFITGITVLVVAIPEGLPLAVTISLAYSVKKMQKENNLVRKMQACETMGGADMICSDKTGTLTQNKMTINEFWAGSMYISTNKDNNLNKTSSPTHFYLLKESIFTNTSAFIDPVKGEQGSKSEIALLLFMIALGHGDYHEMRNNYYERFYKIFPFSSKRKRSSTVISLEDGRRRVHLKGAVEIILKSCTTLLNADGDLKTIGPDVLSTINTIINDMTSKALRVLAIAYKDMKTDVAYDELDEQGFPRIENYGFTLLGLAGIRDPIRDEVPDAVLKCQRAGITVRMVTGDNKSTAQAIAKECYIIKSDEQTVMEGKEFAEITGGTVCSLCRTKICPCPRNKAEKKNTNRKIRKDVVANFTSFKDIIKNLAVLARSAPDDKYTLVTGLRDMGHVVAVTGDGTNDAPALRKADIGFAMGIAGTDMAKEAAGIILLDDNFGSIVRAVVWGRNVYDNIRCFLQFQLTVNVVAVISAMVGAITIQQSPLTSVQLLWVNMIMDSFASLALATDPPTDEHLNRQPYKKDEFIITRIMWKHIIGQALLQLGLMLTMMFVGEWFLPEYSTSKHILKNGDCVGSGRLYDVNGNKDYHKLYNDPDFGPSRHFTYIFNIFVILQLFNEINSRKLRDEINICQRIHKNWLFLIIWVLTIMLQVVIIQLTNYAFSVSIYGLSLVQWFVSLGFGTLAIFWRFLLVFIPSGVFPEVRTI